MVKAIEKLQDITRWAEGLNTNSDSIMLLAEMVLELIEEVDRLKRMTKALNKQRLNPDALDPWLKEDDITSG